MQSMKNSAKRTFRAPLLGTSFFGLTVWVKYALMKSALESRMLTVESVSMRDQIYREEISHLIERNYLSGAILVLWLLYLLWRWIRVFRHASF